MKNTFIALAAAGTLAAALPSPAQAHCVGCGVAAGVVGGLAAGAIIGGSDDTAEAKMRIMRECGIKVADSPADIGITMAECFK